MKNKILTIISLIVVIIILFLARTIYSKHNLKKVIGACILAQTQTSSIEERKNIMSQRYSGKSRKDSSTMKKSKLSLLEKRKIKREKKKKR